MKLLLLFAARGGAGGALADAVVAEATRLRGAGATSVCAMRQIDSDPFALAVPGMRTFEASIDARFDTIEAAGAPLDGLADRFAALVHVDLSGVFGGDDHVVIPGPPTPVRYQYLMRRRIHTGHQQYLDHYIHNHAKFGLRTQGIEAGIDVARRDLAIALGISAAPTHASVVKWERGIAQYQVGHRDHVRAATVAARAQRIALAGADYRGASINELCADASVVVEEVRSWA